MVQHLLAWLFFCSHFFLSALVFPTHSCDLPHVRLLFTHYDPPQVQELAPLDRLREIVTYHFIRRAILDRYFLAVHPILDEEETNVEMTGAFGT